MYLRETRTDNAIKNHWNCSMKKKLDASSPGLTSHMLVKVEGQSLNQIVSPKQSYRLKHNVDTSVAELIRQSALGEKFSLEKSGSERTLGISTVGESRLISSPNGMNFINGVVTCWKDNASTTRSMASDFDVSLDSLTTELDSVPLEVATSVTYELSKSPKRLRFSSSDVVDGKSCSPLLSHPRLANDEEEGEVGSKSRINSMPSHNYYPTESVKFPSNENHIDGYYHSPPKSALRNITGDSSPESVLRSLAMTFENIPSIIRKRTARKTPSLHNCDPARTPLQMIFSSPENEHSNSLDNFKPKQGGFISFTHKTKTSAISKSLQGCMEFACNIEI